MRKIVALLFIFTFSFLILGCNTKAEPDIHGYVMERTNDSIFVVSKYAYDFSENGGVSEFYDAIVLDNAPDNVDVGHEVRVWYKGPVRESYPLGGSVGSLEIVETEKPEGANLSREEAIQQALATISEGNFITITNIEFNAEDQLWRISYKPIEYFEDKPSELKTIEVVDRIN